MRRRLSADAMPVTTTSTATRTTTTHASLRTPAAAAFAIAAAAAASGPPSTPAIVRSASVATRPATMTTRSPAARRTGAGVTCG